MGFLGVMRSLTVAVTSFLPIAGAMSAALLPILAIGSALKFEEELSNAAIAFDIFGKKGEAALGRIAEKAKEVGRTTRFTSQEALKALTTLGLGGLSESQARGTVDTVTDLAAVVDEFNTLSASTVLVDNMRRYGLTAKETTVIADNLAAAQNAVQKSAAVIAEAHRTVGAQTAIMGATFEDTNRPLLAMIAFGVEAATAGTALRLSLQKLIGPTKEAQRAMSELGFNVDEFMTKAGVLKGDKTLTDLFEKMASLGITPAQSKAIFGAKGAAISAVFKLIQDDLKGLNDTWSQIKEVSNRTGFTAEAAAFKIQRGWGPLLILWSAISELFLTIGQAMKPVIDGLTTLLKATTDLIARVSGPTLSGLTATAEGIREVLEAIASALDSISLKNLMKDSQHLFKFAIEAGGSVISFLFELAKDAIGRLVDFLGASIADAMASVHERTLESQARVASRFFGRAGSEAVLELGGGRIESLRDFANERRKSLEERGRFFIPDAAGDETALQRAFGAAADQIMFATDSFLDATKRDRMEAIAQGFRKPVLDLIQTSNQLAADNPIRQDLLELSKQGAALSARFQTFAGTLTGAKLREFEERLKAFQESATSMIDEAFTGRIEVKAAVVPGVEPGEDDKEEIATAIGKSQIVAANALQAHFQSLKQGEDKTNDLLDQANDLAEEANDALDDIAANTNNMVPGGWVKTGGTVLGAAGGFA
jgi:TP901 family phage tail tape measure protein